MVLARSLHFFSAVSTVAGQREDGGLWTHGVIIGDNSSGH